MEALILQQPLAILWGKLKSVKIHFQSNGLTFKNICSKRNEQERCLFDKIKGNELNFPHHMKTSRYTCSPLKLN